MLGAVAGSAEEADGDEGRAGDRLAIGVGSAAFKADQPADMAGDEEVGAVDVGVAGPAEVGRVRLAVEHRLPTAQLTNPRLHCCVCLCVTGEVRVRKENRERRLLGFSEKPRKEGSLWHLGSLPQNYKEREGAVERKHREAG